MTTRHRYHTLDRFLILLVALVPLISAANADPANFADTYLAKLAAGLEPGEFTSFEAGLPPGVERFSDLLRGRRPDGRSAPAIDTWTDSGQWDPLRKRAFFQGLRKINRFISYSASANRWSELDLDLDNAPPMFERFGHLYGRTALDATHGHYYRLAGGKLHRFLIDDNRWEKFDNPPIGGYISIDWHGGLKMLVGLSNHALHGFRDGQWFPLGKATVQGHHSSAKYNPRRNDMLFIGGNHARRAVTLLRADGSIHPMQDAPFDFGISKDKLTHDPRSGNYLVLHRNRVLWEYDPDVDEWRVARDMSGPDANWPFGPRGGIVPIPIDELGVILWMHGGSSQLYRHQSVFPSSASQAMQPAEATTAPSHSSPAAAPAPAATPESATKPALRPAPTPPAPLALPALPHAPAPTPPHRAQAPMPDSPRHTVARPAEAVSTQVGPVDSATALSPSAIHAIRAQNGGISAWPTEVSPFLTARQLTAPIVHAIRSGQALDEIMPPAAMQITPEIPAPDERTALPRPAPSKRSDLSTALPPPVGSPSPSPAPAPTPAPAESPAPSAAPANLLLAHPPAPPPARNYPPHQAFSTIGKTMKPGEWRYVKTAKLPNFRVAFCDQAKGSTHALGWTDAFAYDPETQSFWAVGMRDVSEKRLFFLNKDLEWREISMPWGHDCSRNRRPFNRLSLADIGDGPHLYWPLSFGPQETRGRLIRAPIKAYLSGQSEVAWEQVSEGFGISKMNGAGDYAVEWFPDLGGWVFFGRQSRTANPTPFSQEGHTQEGQTTGKHWYGQLRFLKPGNPNWIFFDRTYAGQYRGKLLYNPIRGEMLLAPGGEFGDQPPGNRPNREWTRIAPRGGDPQQIGAEVPAPLPRVEKLDRGIGEGFDVPGYTVRYHTVAYNPVTGDYLWWDRREEVIRSSPDGKHWRIYEDFSDIESSRFPPNLRRFRGNQGLFGATGYVQMNALPGTDLVVFFDPDVGVILHRVHSAPPRK